MRLRALALLFAALVPVALSAQDLPLKPGAPLPKPTAAPSTAGNAVQIEWRDLLPPGTRESATLVAPTPLHDYLNGEDGPAALQPMNFDVNATLANRLVRLPGFIVPLDIDPQGRVTRMFLVPYFGACIHVPPPAPNQIVHVSLQKPLPLDAMYSAFWVTGRLQVSKRETRLGASAYAIADANTEEYKF